MTEASTVAGSNPMRGEAKGAKGGDEDSKSCARNACWMWAAVFFLLVSLGLAAALIARELTARGEEGEDGEGDVGSCVSDPSSGDRAELLGSQQARVAALFDPLGAEEANAIRAYVEEELNLTPLDEVVGGLADYLWALEVLPAPKDDVVPYIEGSSGTSPGRFARATVMLGSAGEVRFYKVGPLPLAANTPVVHMTHPTIPYMMRPVMDAEYNKMEELMSAFFEEAAAVIQAAYGVTYDDVFWTDGAPRGYSGDDRLTWLWVVDYRQDGMYLRPFGIEILIDHTSSDLEDMHIDRIVFNGQLFLTTAALVAAFDADTLQLPVFEQTADQASWSTMEPRGDRRAREDLLPPRIVYPEGRRFVVEGNSVGWLGWQFHVAPNRQGGPTFHDVRFKGERIAYEIALLDAFARYNGYAPLQAHSQYNDAGWGQGISSFSLIRGVDCPVDALFLDNVFHEGSSSSRIRDAFCIFEAPTGTVMRHFDQNFEGGYNFIAGVPGTKLIVLTTASVYNYDYTIRMQFHPDGSIEARAAASGYVQAQWWMQGGEEDPFSHKIHNYTIGSLHEHQFLWKLDADILGRENAVFKKHYAKEDIVSPWGGVLPAPTMTMLKPVKTPITTEAEGSSTLDVDPADPAHFHIHPHPSQPNAWGLPRTYMLDIFTEMRSLFDADDDTIPWFPANEWTKHNAYVTVRHEVEERGGWPQFDMQGPSDPIQPFSSYTNAETLDGEDLVLWIVHGVIHLPHAEDVPVTYSLLDGTGWLFRPYNYNNEANIRDLHTAVYKSATTGADLETGTPHPEQDCATNTPDFKYEGLIEEA